MRRIYDCFTFFNELHLLELRLNELNDVVDKFVLVEGERTWQNKDKELYFEKNKHIFDNFADKIIHVVVPATESQDNSWSNESHAFNCIARGLESASDDDLIMISAVDEIPKPARIRELHHSLDTGVHFLQQLYYLYFNTKFGEASTDWPGTYMSPYKLLKAQGCIYDAAIRSRNKIPFVADGGWHFSYTGGPEYIFSKLQSFAHTEWVHMTMQDIEKRFETLSDPIERSSGMKFRGYDALENMPQTVQNNMQRYSQYFINV